MHMGHSKWRELAAPIDNDPERRARALAMRDPEAQRQVDEAKAQRSAREQRNSD